MQAGMATQLAKQGVEPFASWAKLPKDTLITPRHSSADVNILVVGGAGFVGSGVGTPVAKKTNNFRLEARHWRIASISARIWSLVKWLPLIAPDGQAATQVPHPWHRSALTDAVRPSAV